MEYYNIPIFLRILMGLTYFISISRCYLNYQLMYLRYRGVMPLPLAIYFLLNLLFNILSSVGVLLMEVQQQIGPNQFVSLPLNWLLLVPIFGHLLMLAYVAPRQKRPFFNRNSLFLIDRIVLMCLLLPFPAKYIRSLPLYHFLILMFLITWIIAGYYYVNKTAEYLSTHFTDYTKIQAYELFPHGLVITTVDGTVKSMNPKAMSILSGLDWTDPKAILQALDSYDGKVKQGPEMYRINRQILSDGINQYIVWDLVNITQLNEIQADIDASTAAIKGAWKILRNILDQVKQSVHHEEQVRLQHHMHDVLGEGFSVMSYMLQGMEGRMMTEEERSTLTQLLDRLYVNLEDRATGGSDNSFQALKQSFQRIGVNIRLFGTYPVRYHYRNLTYQILREAASNALKHGAATEITLNMKVDGDGYHFSIINNGTLTTDPNEQGLGLRGMHRMVHDLHGEINIDPENQYRIDVSLPLN